MFLYLKSHNKSTNTKLWAGTCWFSCQPDVCWPCLSQLNASVWRAWRRGNGWHQWKPCLQWAAHYLSHLRLLILSEKLVGAAGVSWEQIWNGPKLCEEQLSFCPSWASRRSQPVQTLTLSPWPWLPCPCPCRMLLLTDDSQARAAGRESREGAPCQGEELSTAQEGQGTSPAPAQAHRAGTAGGWGGICQAHGCQQIPEFLTSQSFWVPGGRLVTLHRLTAGVGAGYTSSGSLHPQRQEGFRSRKGIFCTQAAQRS